MKRLTLASLVLALTVGLALPALAHDFTGEGDCTGWTLQLDGTYGAHTILINGQAQSEVATEYFVGDNRPGVTSRTFTVTWDKDQGDVTRQVTLERDLSRCVDFTYSSECGEISTSLTNETALSYAVAIEEGAATYDLGNAVFGSAQFAEDYNGGSVDVSLYVVGAEADFVTGRGIPNFWEQSAVQVTVTTDCVPPETTPTTVPEEPTTTTLPEEEPTTTTTVPEVTIPELPTFTGSSQCEDGITTITVDFDPAEFSQIDVYVGEADGSPDSVITEPGAFVWGELFSDEQFTLVGHGEEFFQTVPLIAEGCAEESVVIQPRPNTPTTTELTELPFTGIEDSPELLGLATSAIVMGFLMLRSARGRDEEAIN